MFFVLPAFAAYHSRETADISKRGRWLRLITGEIEETADENPQGLKLVRVKVVHESNNPKKTNERFIYMELKKKLSMGALAATISIASLSLISSGCKTTDSSSAEAKACGAEKKCGGEKKCAAEKQCGAEKKCGGEKSCGAK